MTNKVTAVRRVCSTQTEVRVFGNGSEHWYFLWCPIAMLTESSTDDWIWRQNANVVEALERIERQEWVTPDDFQKVIDQLHNAGGLVPYKYRVTIGDPIVL